MSEIEILIVCAGGWETRLLARRLKLQKKPGPPICFRGQVKDKQVTLIEQNSLEAWPGRAGQTEPALLIHAGFAAPLQAGVRPGDVVSDPRGLDLEILRKLKDAQEQSRTPLHLGPLKSDEGSLSKDRALALDPEGPPVRSWAESRRMTYLPVKALSKTPEAGVSWAQPWIFLPALWRRRRAMNGLGSFLEKFL